jgi:hypothetical protein
MPCSLRYSGTNYYNQADGGPCPKVTRPKGRFLGGNRVDKWLAERSGGGDHSASTTH